MFDHFPFSVEKSDVPHSGPANRVKTNGTCTGFDRISAFRREAGRSFRTPCTAFLGKLSEAAGIRAGFFSDALSYDSSPHTSLCRTTALLDVAQTAFHSLCRLSLKFPSENDTASTRNSQSVIVTSGAA